MRRRRNALSRRRFLRSSLAAAAGLAAAPALAPLIAGSASAQRAAKGYGPLVKDPGELLDLPKGFDYVVLSTALASTEEQEHYGARLGNGEPVPGRPDGMATFKGLPEITVVVRNHELAPHQFPAVDPARRRPYDPLAHGGTTTMWVDADRRLIRSFPSLSGTTDNCGGGATPWGTWLSCEEQVFLPGPADPKIHDITPAVSKPHGYVFEVDARAEGLVEPLPLRAMGRFAHEAAGVDPATGFVYLSEDRPDGLLYRFRPSVLREGLRTPDTLRPGDLARGGTLEALKIVEQPGALTQNWNDDSPLRPRSPYAVDWVPIDEPDPAADMERDPEDSERDPLERRGRTAKTATRAQGFALGAAQFARGEGLVYHRGAIWLSATDGGPTRSGQVWRLDLLRQELAWWLEPGDRDLLDGPDNLCGASWGDLLVCEDGMSYNRVVGITGSRRFYPIARCRMEGNELTGACFSPDGRTFFVNTQDPGITFAIRGPWRGH